MKSYILAGFLFVSSLFSSNYIVVEGSSFTLSLYNEEDVLLCSYPIGIGKNGMGKTKEGDLKTPVGEYKILWKASRFAKEDGGHFIKEGCAFCGPNNVFTQDPEIGYPEEALWTDSYGGGQAVVLCLDYPNKKDLDKGYTGDAIEIHATHLGGIQELSSAGCVRMTPEDARDLYRQVEVGTKVFLSE